MRCAARNKRRTRRHLLACLVPVLAIAVAIPLAGASGDPITSPGLTVAEAHAEVVRSEQRLVDATAARDAARTELERLNDESRALVEQLADARATLRDRAVEAYVSATPDETLLFLLGDGRASDASARFHLMAHSATRTEDAVERFERLKDEMDPELVRLATALQRLEQDLVDASDAVLAARANEAEAERQEAERERIAAIVRAQMAATTTTTTTEPTPPVAAAMETPAEPAGDTATPTTTAPPPPPTTQPVTVAPPGGPSEAKWAALRNCESSGNYRAVSKSGKYRGAYQFDMQTWATLGAPGDPAAASPAEQDARAKLLYSKRGWRPWPVCGRHLQ